MPEICAGWLFDGPVWASLILTEPNLGTPSVISSGIGFTVAFCITPLFESAASTEDVKDANALKFEIAGQVGEIIYVAHPHHHVLNNTASRSLEKLNSRANRCLVSSGWMTRMLHAPVVFSAIHFTRSEA